MLGHKLENRGNHDHVPCHDLISKGTSEARVRSKNLCLGSLNPYLTLSTAPVGTTGKVP